MKNMVSITLVMMLLAGCAVPGAVQPGETYKTRELTFEEKRALTPLITDNLKDPEAARIKWMPVVLRERDGITDYCGLLNGKNSYGGYTGYTRFYGQLVKDEKGRFSKIIVKAMEEPNREVNMFDPRWLNGLCENYGYIDFSLAH